MADILQQVSAPQAGKMVAFTTPMAPPTGMVAREAPAGQASGMVAPRPNTGVRSSASIKRRSAPAFCSSLSPVISLASPGGAASARTSHFVRSRRKIRAGQFQGTFLIQNCAGVHFGPNIL